MNLISGFASKNMASSVFIAHRAPASITENDNNIPLVKLADVTVDDKSATGSVYGLMELRLCFN